MASNTFCWAGSSSPAGVVAPLAMMRLLGEEETGLRANALLMIASYTAQGIVILVICRKLARASS